MARRVSARRRGVVVWGAPERADVPAVSRAGAVLAIIVHLCTFAVIRVQRVHSKARHHNGDPERAPEAAKIGAIMND